MSIDTDLGPIPDGWVVRSLPEICTMRSGGTPPKTDPSLWAGTMPWVSGKDLKTPRLFDAIDHITPEAAEDFSKVAPAGSVLVLVRGMGLANGFALSLIERPMAFNQDLKALTPKDGLSGAFLMYALTYAGARMLHNVADAAHGTKRLSQDDLDNFRLPIPPPDEQRAIVEFLDCVLQAIDVERRTLLCSEEVKRSSLKGLFTQGLRGEAQKETEIGLLPESWSVVEFKDVREWLQYGTSVHCTLDEKRYPVLRIPNVEPGRINPTELKYCDLSANDSEKYLLRDGDLLFIRTNGVIERLGSCAVYRGEPSAALFASYLIRARLKAKVDPRYIAYFYASALGTSLVAGRATPAADGKYNLNTGTIDSLPLALSPNLDEQREIVEILEAIDRKIELHQKKRSVLEALFKALLHKLMTGIVRVDQLNLLAPEAPPRQEASA